MSMVEKAAKAIYAVEYDIEAYPWEQEAREVKNLYGDQARAALRALREPSPEMIAGVYAAFNASDKRPITIEECFTIMVDAALGTGANVKKAGGE